VTGAAEIGAVAAKEASCLGATAMGAAQAATGRICPAALAGPAVKEPNCLVVVPIDATGPHIAVTGAVLARCLAGAGDALRQRCLSFVAVAGTAATGGEAAASCLAAGAGDAERCLCHAGVNLAVSVPVARIWANAESMRALRCVVVVEGIAPSHCRLVQQPCTPASTGSCLVHGDEALAGPI